MVPVVEPLPPIRLDTPAGLVTAALSVVDSHAEAVTLTNVASFALQLDHTVAVEGFGDVS
jgi:proline racemase